MATPVLLVGAVFTVITGVGVLFSRAFVPSFDTPLRAGRTRRRRVGRSTGPHRQRSLHPTVSVVVPTLNEADNLGWVLERLPAWVTEVVLVDGLSTDHTEVVARDLRQDVIVVHQLQPGKGAALRAGFAAATGDVIVMIDADGSTNPEEMAVFVTALQNGAEFVKGSRYLGAGGSDDWTRIRSAGNRAFVHMVNVMYGSRFTDLCYGYCAFWRRDLDALALDADGFEIETQLTLNAIKAGLKIEEVGSYELPRRAGSSNLNAVRDGLRVLRTIFAERPGRDSRRAATHSRIALVPVELPAPGSVSWKPAGHDRRRDDRRVLDRSASGYSGPERRRTHRRHQPKHTVVVYRAIEAPPEVSLKLAA